MDRRERLRGRERQSVAETERVREREYVCISSFLTPQCKGGGLNILRNVLV